MSGLLEGKLGKIGDPANFFGARNNGKIDWGAAFEPAGSFFHTLTGSSALRKVNDPLKLTNEIPVDPKKKPVRGAYNNVSVPNKTILSDKLGA